jgi:hypothetical protein
MGRPMEQDERLDALLAQHRAVSAALHPGHGPTYERVHLLLEERRRRAQRERDASQALLDAALAAEGKPRSSSFCMAVKHPPHVA